LLHVSERLFAVAGLLLLSPLLVVFALLLLLSSPGSPLEAERARWPDGSSARYLRFRTDSAYGAWLKQTGMYALPALWSLAIGQIRLNQVLGLERRGGRR
jgi:hypothetical protein